MIEKILELLYTDEFLASSEYIDIAKGKYKITKTKEEKAKQTKREKAWL
jgi:hypothetical protein